MASGLRWYQICDHSRRREQDAGPLTDTQQRNTITIKRYVNVATQPRKWRFYSCNELLMKKQKKSTYLRRMCDKCGAVAWMASGWTPVEHEGVRSDMFAGLFQLVHPAYDRWDGNRRVANETERTPQDRFQLWCTIKWMTFYYKFLVHTQ